MTVTQRQQWLPTFRSPRLSRAFVFLTDAHCQCVAAALRQYFLTPSIVCTLKVLLSSQKNSQAKNFDFGRKKTEYFQKEGVATFALTSQVLNEPNWTIDVLQQRQKKVVEGSGSRTEAWLLIFNVFGS